MGFFTEGVRVTLDDEGRKRKATLVDTDNAKAMSVASLAVAQGEPLYPVKSDSLTGYYSNTGPTWGSIWPWGTLFRASPGYHVVESSTYAEPIRDHHRMPDTVYTPMARSPWSSRAVLPLTWQQLGFGSSVTPSEPVFENNTNYVMQPVYDTLGTQMAYSYDTEPYPDYDTDEWDAHAT